MSSSLYRLSVLAALVVGVAAHAAVIPATELIRQRQATGNALIDNWQAPPTPYTYFTFTATSSWTASISGGWALVSPSSGAPGTQTVRVAADYFTTPGLRAATLTVTGGGGTATLSLDVLPQQPFANFGSAPPDCTNPVPSLYPAPMLCNGDSGGTLIAPQSRLAYSSKHAECGGMLMVRQTISPLATRIISGVDGSVLYDNLPGSDENNNWDKASGCTAFFHLDGLTLKRRVLATGISTTVWQAPGGYDLLSDGGPHPVAEDGWYALMLRPTGAGGTRFWLVCAIQTIGLTVVNQAAQTWCIDLSAGLDGNPPPDLVDSPYLYPPDRLGRRRFEIGATGGSYWCDFSTSTGITNCRRWEWYRSVSNNENDVCSTFAGTGTVSATASTTLTGTGTLFTVEFAVGYSLTTSDGQTRRITAIGSNTSLTLDTAITVSGLSYVGSEVCWPTAHSDGIEIAGESYVFWPYEDYRAVAALTDVGKGQRALRSKEEGGGTTLIASIRSDGRTGQPGSEYGCQKPFCFWTSYSSYVGASEPIVPLVADLQVNLLDTRDNSLHIIASDRRMRTPAAFDYTTISQVNVSMDGCTAYYTAGFSAIEFSVYRKATGLCLSEPPKRERIGLTARAAATHAVISYVAPTSAACTVAVATHPMPMAHVTTLHPDTAIPALDSRPGSVSNGLNRQFVVGTETPLTPSTLYHARVNCGSWAYFLQFRTRATGAGGSMISGPVATGEISSSSDMSASSPIPSAADHLIAVPPGGVRYYRRSGGAVQVVL
jgi:hypothetical protein